MTIDNNDLLNSILTSLDRVRFISPEDIPNIDLYMDQITTFMDSHLHSTARNPGEDKILTKTMINNYAKNDLLPPPVKKKYSKEHVLLLIFIYYYKGILSISDIQKLLGPITERFFKNGESGKRLQRSIRHGGESDAGTESRCEGEICGGSENLYGCVGGRCRFSEEIRFYLYTEL